MAHEVSDVLEVMVLAREVGLCSRAEDGGWTRVGVDLGGASARVVWRSARDVFIAGTGGALCLAALASTPASAQYATPDCPLPTPDGDTVSLHDALADGPVVFSFWATWCIPCLKELPHLNEMAGEFGDEVSFIAVSVDNSKSMAKVGPLVRAKNWLNLTIAQDAGGEVQQILQVLSPPYTVVYDAAGREVFRHEGYRQGDEDELRHVIEEMLATPVPAAISGPAPGGVDWSDAVTATNQFEYSYSLDTDDEIVENWLDLAYQFGDFRTSIMLNHQAPSEDGNRRNEIVHRYIP